MPSYIVHAKRMNVSYTPIPQYYLFKNLIPLPITVQVLTQSRSVSSSWITSCSLMAIPSFLIYLDTIFLLCFDFAQLFYLSFYLHPLEMSHPNASAYYNGLIN